MLGILEASIVFPDPGGPIIITWCPPAAATCKAHFVCSWPNTSDISPISFNGLSLCTGSTLSAIFLLGHLIALLLALLKSPAFSLSSTLMWSYLLIAFSARSLFFSAIGLASSSNFPFSSSTKSKICLIPIASIPFTSFASSRFPYGIIIFVIFFCLAYSAIGSIP